MNRKFKPGDNIRVLGTNNDAVNGLRGRVLLYLVDNVCRVRLEDGKYAHLADNFLESREETIELPESLRVSMDEYLNNILDQIDQTLRAIDDSSDVLTSSTYATLRHRFESLGADVGELCAIYLSEHSQS